MWFTTSSNRRRAGGVAVGAALASPLFALLVGSAASAQPGDEFDTTVYGPFLTFTDTVVTNTTTGGFDSLLTSPDWGFFDVYYGGLDTSGIVLTDPDMYQVGYQVIDGDFSFIYTMNPDDFISADAGLAAIGGVT